MLLVPRNVRESVYIWVNIIPLHEGESVHKFEVLALSSEPEGQTPFSVLLTSFQNM